MCFACDMQGQMELLAQMAEHIKAEEAAKAAAQAAETTAVTAEPLEEELARISPTT